MKKTIFSYVFLIIFLFLFIGEVKCIVKAFRCNWRPVGRAEVIYTISAATGVGCVVGWFNIKDK